jgi:hypothetical protein
MEKKAEDVLEAEGPDSPILEDLYDVCSHPFFFFFWTETDPLL